MSIEVLPVGEIVAANALLKEGILDDDQKEITASNVANVVGSIVDDAEKVTPDDETRTKVIATALKEASALSVHRFNHRLFMHDVVAEMARSRFYRAQYGRRI